MLNERTLCEALRRNFELEAVKIAVEFFGRLRKMREWTLWRSWPPPKRKKGHHKHVANRL
jgi:hypothetical protein